MKSLDVRERFKGSCCDSESTLRRKLPEEESHWPMTSLILEYPMLQYSFNFCFKMFSCFSGTHPVYQYSFHKRHTSELGTHPTAAVAVILTISVIRCFLLLFSVQLSVGNHCKTECYSGSSHSSDCPL